MSTNTTKTKLLNYWDGEHAIATHAANLLLGNGVQLTSENEEVENFLNKVFDLNEINVFLYSLVYWLSKKGRAIATISKNKAGKYRLEIAKPDWVNSLAKIHITPKLAVLYKRTVIANNIFTIRESWDDKKVVRDLFNKNDQQVSLDTMNAKLKPEEKIEGVWNHNLGFIPIIEFLNKPIWASTMSGDGVYDNSYDMLKDTYGSEEMVELINHLYRTIKRETEIGGTRVIGTYNAQEIKQLNSEDKQNEILTSQLLLNIKQPGGAGQVPPFEKIQPTQNYIMELFDTIKKIKTEYFDNAGYSADVSDVVQNSATATLFGSKKDFSTNKLKRDYLIEKMLKLIDMILIIEGKEVKEEVEGKTEREYAFLINENTGVSRTETINNVILLRDNGLLTLTEAIAEIRNISEEEAQEIVDKINSEQEAEQQKQQETFKMVNELQNENLAQEEQENPQNPNEVKKEVNNVATKPTSTS